MIVLALLVGSSASWVGRAASEPAPGSDAPTGLLVHWTLDEVGGQRIEDSSGHGHHASFQDPGPRWERGRIGGGLHFDGAGGGFAEAQDGAAFLNGLSELTITLWVKSDRTRTNRGLLIATEPDGRDEVLSLRYDAAGWANGNKHRRLIKAGITTTGGVQQIESSREVQTRGWQFIALRWESGKQLQLFLNGELDEPTFNSHATEGVLTGATLLRLGQGAKDRERSWDGMIDDVRIYGRALGEQELRARYLESANLIAHWKLDETGGSTAADASGHGHHATFNCPGPQWTEGKLEGALAFSGADRAYVEDAAGADYVNGLSAFTVTMWVKSNRVRTNRGLLAARKPDGKDEALSLRYDAAGWANDNEHTNLIKAGITTTGGVQQIESSAGVQTRDWQFLALTWTSGEELQLYIDGAPDRPTYNSRPTRGLLTGATGLRLGQGPKDGRRTWDGLMDDVRLYGRVLSAEEIRRLAEPRPVLEPPRGLVSTVVTSRRVGLAWEPSVSASVMEYAVYRDGVRVAHTPATTFEDEGLTPSTPYEYSVTARDAAGGESVASAALAVATKEARDETAPTVPPGATATALGSTQALLSWAASTDVAGLDEPTSGLAGYRVYRDGALRAALGNVTTFADSGLAAAHTYLYSVSAFDAAGNESSPASLAPLTTPEPVITIETLGGSGGALATRDGRLALTFPPGALEETTTISIEEIPAPSWAVGPAYRLGPAGARFALPVAVQYQLPSEVLSAAPQLRLLISSGGSWDVLSDYASDVAAGLLHGTTSHFSTLAVGNGHSLAGVHWYQPNANDSLLDTSVPAGLRGWNVESVFDVSGRPDDAIAHASAARSDGLTNIIRLDYRGGLAVPVVPDELDAWGTNFIARVREFSEPGLARRFIVGNEPPLAVEGAISAQEYSAAFNHLYARKDEMPAGTELLAAGPNAFGDLNSVPNTVWLEEVAKRLVGVDGFAIHTYGYTENDVPTCTSDPREPCQRGDPPWEFDGGFRYYRDQIARITPTWPAKPIYITEFNTDTNGRDPRNPSENYTTDFINQAYEEIRDYNAEACTQNPVLALAWFVDRRDDQWDQFALSNPEGRLPDARADMREEFANAANRESVCGSPPPEPPDDDPCPTVPGTTCSSRGLSLCLNQSGTITRTACEPWGCIDQLPGTADQCGDPPVCQNGRTQPASPVAQTLPSDFSIHLPFADGTQVVITDAYGPGKAKTHARLQRAGTTADYYSLDLVPIEDADGNAIADPIGTPVLPVAAATVHKVGYEVDSNGNGYGHFVILQHSPPHQQYYSMYAHLQTVSRSVGDVVSAADAIGTLGNSGNVEAHLHLSVYYNENAPEQDGHRGARAVVPEPIDGYGCLEPRVGLEVLRAGGPRDGTVHTDPMTVTQSTTLEPGDLYLVPSASTSLVNSRGVLASPSQDSTALFPVAAIQIHDQSSITLDCSGVWIQSEEGDLTADRSNDKFYSGVGIRVRNSSDVVVRNCNVSGYRYGILVEDSTNVTLENNRSTHNYRYFTAEFFSDSASIPSHHFGGGIRVWRGSQVRLAGNQGDNQMSGIELIATDDSEVRNNRFNYDQVGLYLGRSSRNRVVDNNFDWGIRFETRTWTDGSPAQRLLRGGAFAFMDQGLLRVQEDGAVGGLAVKRIMRLMDRDTARPYWDVATMTLDAAGVLIENASHDNEIRGNSLNFGGDGLFIRANQTPCSNGNVVRDNEAAYSPNNGLELSFCDGTFENNLVHSNQHGMWLGAGANNVMLRGNRFANNLAYAVLGARNGLVTFAGNTVSNTPVAIGMRAERWGGSLNLPADGAVTPVRDWSVEGNTFDGIRGGAYPWMLLGANDGAVFRLSGVERFNARSNTYGAGSDRCSLPHPFPVPGTPPNREMNLDCASAGGLPVPQFVFPTDGQAIAGGAHHDFVCNATDDQALQSVEIVFNDEHRKRCDYAQSPAVKGAECQFVNFYVGSDLDGQTVPMDCHATDWTGQTQTHHIGVIIGEPDPPPYVQFQSPTDGQRVSPGHNDFTCYASDNKNLDFIEIWFNDEHHHRCDFGPVTSGTCTFSNFYVGSDLLGQTIPMRCEAADLDGNTNQHEISVAIGSPDAAPPAADFLSPTGGARLVGGIHHDFSCTGTDDTALRSLEIVFNNEHRQQCDYAQGAAVQSAECRFENFYIGTDLIGKTIPMRCEARDWAGRTGTQYINVEIVASDDTQAPYVQFQRPTNGQRVPPGNNDFTCYASDNKNLDYVEIWFNNEHHHRCDFGPVTSGTCTFSNFYVGSDLLGRTIPMRCEAADLAGNTNRHDISVEIGTDDAAAPAADFVSPSGGARLVGGIHHDFSCRGTDDTALQSLEIVFNNEHRRRCDYSQSAGVRSAECRFENFYVGTDLIGRTIPMRCEARDWAGRTGTQYINVEIVDSADTQAPYVQFQHPTNGQTVPPGHNDFTCYASDNKNLDFIEIWFNNEHHHRCNFGPVTSGSCTFGNFYVGADLLGRTIPMRCEAADLSGNRNRHDIGVRIEN